MDTNVQIRIACALDQMEQFMLIILNYVIPFPLSIPVPVFRLCAFVMADTNLTGSIERTSDNSDVTKNREKPVEGGEEGIKKVTTLKVTVDLQGVFLENQYSAPSVQRIYQNLATFLVSLAAVVRVGPKLAHFQRQLSRATHSIPAFDQ